MLTSLARADNYGYAIADDVRRRSRGTIRLAPGTLYRALAQLRDGRLIALTTAREPLSLGKARVLYRVTHAGRRRLNEEINRMQCLLCLGENAIDSSRRNDRPAVEVLDAQCGQPSLSRPGDEHAL